MDDRFQGNVSNRGEMARRDVDAPSLSVLSEIHSRLAKVEADNEEIRGILDEAIKSGQMDAGLTAKVAHVMQHYFPHDNPPAEVVAAPVPRFDAYTGQPLN